MVRTHHDEVDALRIGELEEVVPEAPHTMLRPEDDVTLASQIADARLQIPAQERFGLRVLLDDGMAPGQTISRRPLARKPGAVDIADDDIHGARLTQRLYPSNGSVAASRPIHRQQQAQRALAFRPCLEWCFITNDEHRDLRGLREALGSAADAVEEGRAVPERRDHHEPRLLLFGKPEQGVAGRTDEDGVVYPRRAVLNQGAYTQDRLD